MPRKKLTTPEVATSETAPSVEPEAPAPVVTIRDRWSGAVIREVPGEDLAGADLRRAVLRRADLAGADLCGAVLAGADLTGAVLTGAVLRRADLAGADLRRADLAGAVLTGAVLTGADLRRADLAGADLCGAVLAGADLCGAVLAGADLCGAVLAGADLTGADLCGAKVNWQSHALIAELLRRAAEADAAKRMVAGLILISTDWCWEQFLGLRHAETDWALEVLAAYVTEGDDAPAVLRRLVKAKEGRDAA